jgi:hypothetical protein
VTFEVLLASFGLDADRGLAQLGRLVHYLDVGGPPVAEAAGFEAVLAGLREAPDDDALLAAPPRCWRPCTGASRPRDAVTRPD